jgi:hypothetical protein
MKKLLFLVSVLFLSACGSSSTSTGTNTATSVVQVPLQINIENGVAKSVALVPLSDKVRIVVSNESPGLFQGFKIMTTVNSQSRFTWTPTVPAIKGYKVDAIFFKPDGLLKRITKYATGTVDVAENQTNGVSLTANTFSNPASPSALGFDTRSALPQLNYTSAFRANIRIPKGKTPFMPVASVQMSTTPITIAKILPFARYSGVTLTSPLIAQSQYIYFQWVLNIDPFYLDTARDGSQYNWIYNWPNPTWGEADLTRYVTVGSGTIGGITITPGI